MLEAANHEPGKAATNFSNLLILMFLSKEEQADHGEEMEEWRGLIFRSKYLSMVRPFSAVPELVHRVREAGLKFAVASSAKSNELNIYLEIAGVINLIDVMTSSDDVAQSKPAPDIFVAALENLASRAMRRLESETHRMTLKRRESPASKRLACSAVASLKPIFEKAAASTYSLVRGHCWHASMRRS